MSPREIETATLVSFHGPGDDDSAQSLSLQPPTVFVGHLCASRQHQVLRTFHGLNAALLGLDPEDSEAGMKWLR